MDKMKIHEIANGAVEEKFEKALDLVVDNLLDPNTKYKESRKITVEISFTENEDRDTVACTCNVKTKLASPKPVETMFAVGRDLRTDEIFIQEYGKQVKGQMSLSDYAPMQEIDGKVVDTDTGEVLEDTDKVMDFRRSHA